MKHGVKCHSKIAQLPRAIQRAGGPFFVVPDVTGLLPCQSNIVRRLKTFHAGQGLEAAAAQPSPECYYWYPLELMSIHVIIR